MRVFQLNAVALTAALLILPTAGHAYIGPGMGAGAIAAVLGIMAAVGLAIIGLVWYPVKRMLRRMKKDPVQPENSDA